MRSFFTALASIAVLALLIGGSIFLIRDKHKTDLTPAEEKACSEYIDRIQDYYAQAAKEMDTEAERIKWEVPAKYGISKERWETVLRVPFGAGGGPH